MHETDIKRAMAQEQGQDAQPILRGSSLGNRNRRHHELEQAPVGEVSEELGRLDKSLAEASGLLSELGKRLDPVLALVPEGHGLEPVKDHGRRSQMGSEVASLDHRAQALNASLRVLLGRLAL